MSMDDPILQDLRAAYDSGNLIVFAGAGVSVGAGLPTWRQLAEKLRDLVRVRAQRRGTNPAVAEKIVEEIKEYIDDHKLIDALSAAKLDLGPEEFNRTVDKALDDTGRDIPDTARAIAALRPRLRAVITTNIDRFLERAFQGEWRMVERPTGDLVRDRGFIFKLHGTLRSWDSWVFSREQYDQAIFRSPELQTAFSSIYQAYPLLFVGCGLADDNLDQMLGRMRALSKGQPPTHFAILWSKMVTPYRRRLLEETGIQLILYDNAEGDHAEVGEILRSLEPGDFQRDTVPSPPPAQSARPPGAAALRASAAVAASSSLSGSDAAPPSATVRSMPAVRPLKVFFCYAPRDEDLLKRLEDHLAPLMRQGVVAPWHAGKVGAGEERDQAVRDQLESAELILLLVSASFLASEQGDAQVARAMERRGAGQAMVMPILLRPCDWEQTRFASLQYLPRDARPVTKWPDEDEAMLQIVKEVRAVVGKLRASGR
jgi:NAD-dependent SIR2 family protein deacetylase